MSAALAGFYVVSAFFSDMGALYYYRIMEVRADGQDSIVRYIRVAPVDVSCLRTIVQAAETRVRGKSPAELAGSANPCAVNQSSINRALGRRKVGHLESMNSDIVAQCGSTERSLRLPDASDEDLQRIESSSPAKAELWRLMNKVIQPLFGERDLFTDRSEQDDLALQRSAEPLIPDLIAGRYDRGLKGAVMWRPATFRLALFDYHGPIASARVKADMIPKLVNAEAYRFRKYEAPAYPPLAKVARIQGHVQLALDIDADTGDVREAAVVVGHPLFRPSALAAAKKWRFEPGTAAHLTVDIEYSLMQHALNCPERYR